MEQVRALSTYFAKESRIILGPKPVDITNVAPRKSPLTTLPAVFVRIAESHDPHLVPLPLLGVSGNDAGGDIARSEVHCQGMRVVERRPPLCHPAGEVFSNCSPAFHIAEGCTLQEEGRQGRGIL